MNTEENKGIENRIIEAAKQVFIQKGYTAATMGDIAAEVGISRTAMHYYFRTKETMFAAIFTQLIETIIPNIDALMNEESTFLEKLPKIIDAYIFAFKDNPSIPLFVIIEMNRDPQRLFSVIAGNYKQIRPVLLLQKQLIDEMEKGVIKKLPLINIVSVFIGLILFPFLAKNAFIHIFMNENGDAYNDFIVDRKQLIYEIMYNMLSPDKQ